MHLKVEAEMKRHELRQNSFPPISSNYATAKHVFMFSRSKVPLATAATGAIYEHGLKQISRLTSRAQPDGSLYTVQLLRFSLSWDELDFQQILHARAIKSCHACDEFTHCQTPARISRHAPRHPTTGSANLRHKAPRSSTANRDH